MDWSPVLAELPKAIPPLLGALVGGFLAAGVGVMTQGLTHRFTRQRDHERLLREKAEALIEVLNQFADWSTTSAGALARQSDHQAPSPWNRAHSLQVLYFPQLAPQFGPIQEAVTSVYQLLVRLRVHPTVTAQAKEEVMVQMRELLLPYYAAVDSITEAILGTSPWKPLGHPPRRRSKSP
ncbi:MAG TPA: hypothetical protein VI542_11790 [Candidatus Tectomicrobia bacterium]